MNDAQILASIKGLSADSRTVKPGFLFTAIPGAHTDGRNFIEAALQAGATHILALPDTALPHGHNATLITDPEPRRRLAFLAAGFYGRQQPEKLVAVTGTNGKTSTVTFAAQLWNALGRKAASLGTLGVHAPGILTKGTLTTPDPISLHAALADLTQAGITRLAMEASSIGIEQHRLAGVRLDAAAFTNLTHDHLDYHGTMAAYYDSKRRLFDTLLPQGATAVINIDDPYGAKLAKEIETRNKLIRIGKTGPEMTLRDQTPTPEGQILQLEIQGKPCTIDLPLVGLFQGINALTAAALVSATEADANIEALIPHMRSLRGVPGRLQKVDGHPKGAGIYVDYAHTPHGLETVLKSLRPHAKGRLVAVFGCGGNRDKTKRPIMGALAQSLADIAIITDDNPRKENPAAIRAEIAAGAPGAKIIGDRKIAIFEAISSLEKGDILVIAGKGHEQGQIIGDTVHPFNDVTIAKEGIDAL